VNLTSCGIVHFFLGKMHRLALRFSSLGEVCGLTAPEQRNFPYRSLSSVRQPYSLAACSLSGFRHFGSHRLLLADCWSVQRVSAFRCCTLCSGSFQNAWA
jgi:hypothetical protein